MSDPTKPMSIEEAVAHVLREAEAERVAADYRDALVGRMQGAIQLAVAASYTETLVALAREAFGLTSSLPAMPSHVTADALQAARDEGVRLMRVVGIPLPASVAPPSEGGR
jgi:hypothetical protein